MKIKKCIAIALAFIIIIMGVSGCMNNQKHEEQIEKMKNYASEKYGEDFSVVYFNAARDASYTHKLTLTNGTYLFNVYQGGDSTQIYDDLIRVVINHKMTEYLNQRLDPSLSDVKLYVNIMLNDDDDLTYDCAKEADMETLLQEYTIMKVIVIVKTADEIETQQDAIFALYNEMLALSPEYIDLEVIQVDEASDALNTMLENLTGYYSRRWNLYREIEASLCVMDKDITSAQDLIKEVK